MSKKFLKEIIKDKGYELPISIPCLEGERWVKVNRDVYPTLKPRYWVSSKGRVYNEESQHMMTVRHLDKNRYSSPYNKVNLQIEIAGRSYGAAFIVHRMMMCSFYPVPGMEKLYVNHIDGNKLNNDLSNLEWCTSSENIKHAYKMGLAEVRHGEDSEWATITEKQAKKIIKLLLTRKYTHPEIAEMMGTTRAVVQAIAIRNSWAHLTKGMDLTILRSKVPKHYLTMDHIEKLCAYFEKNKRGDHMTIYNYCEDALSKIGYPLEKINYYVVMSVVALYRHRSYKLVSSKYNF